MSEADKKKCLPHKMDGGPSTSSVGSGQEEMSAAVDQLLRELYDCLPEDARDTFATKLADWAKKLKNVPRTIPPPSSDLELARREEETAEAEQSSKELTKSEVTNIKVVGVASFPDRPS